LTSDLADFIVSLGGNGTILSQGTDMSVAISGNFKLISEMKNSEECQDTREAASDRKEDPIPADGVAQGKLIVAEDIQQGHITWKAMKLFFSAVGGSYPILFFCAFSFGLLLVDLSTMFQTYLLGYWGSQYTEADPKKINPFLYVLFFGRGIASQSLLQLPKWILSHLGHIGYQLCIFRSPVPTWRFSSMYYYSQTTG